MHNLVIMTHCWVRKLIYFKNIFKYVICGGVQIITMVILSLQSAELNFIQKFFQNKVFSAGPVCWIQLVRKMYFPKNGHTNK